MNELTKKEENLPATQSEQLGFEGVTNEDLEIPRAKLMQGLSEEISEGREGIKLGDIIDSITGDKLPDTFVPVFAFRKWMKFVDGKLAYMADSPNDQNVIEDEDAWQAKTICVLAKFKGVNHPVVLNFRGASFKNGKKFLSLAKFRGGNFFDFSYSLSSQKVQNDKGTFYVLAVKPSAETSAEDKDIARQWFKNFSGKNINVHVEDISEDTNKEESPY